MSARIGHVGRPGAHPWREVSELGSQQQGAYTGPERRAARRDLTARRLAALGDAASRMVMAANVEEVTSIAVAAGVAAIGAQGGTVALRHDRRPVLTLTSTDEYNPAMVERHRELPLVAAVPISHTARTGEALLFRDRAEAVDRFPDAACFQAMTDAAGSRIVAAAVQPLVAGGRLLGSLTTTWDAPRDFSPDDARLLDAVAALTAQALERVRASRVQEQALVHASVLARSAGLLVPGLEPDVVLAAVADLIEPDLADRTVIDLLGWGIHARVPLADTEPGDELGAVRTTVRMTAQGRLMGTLTAVRSTGEQHSPAERALLRSIADRAALVLDHSLLYAEQRETSLALQHALLTAPPERDDLQVFVRYQPALHAAVGGDWYDAFVTESGGTVLVIGDVVGHDAHAAASMGELRGLLRALGFGSDGGPAQLLAETDRAAVGLGVDTLATAVVATVETSASRGWSESRRLRWSNAGHPPPFLISADGKVELLDTSPELMLGIDPSAVRHDHDRELCDGDTLLLYTDGLVERRGAGIEAGLSALADALAEFATLTTDALCDAVLRRMLPHGADDDVALLAVRAQPRDRPRPETRAASPRYDGSNTGVGRQRP